MTGVTSKPVCLYVSLHQPKQLVVNCRFGVVGITSFSQTRRMPVMYMYKCIVGVGFGLAFEPGTY